MSRINSKEILKKASSSRPARSNYTFRLRDDLMNQLKKTCKDNQDVNVTQVIEELIKQFIEDTK